ncbi:hypothetical protein J3R03_005216 [Actinoplanes couchii]|uniref:Secreted protein n=1 Tax=Actinoplanes couchii TaxID=403638 RepID=A0ABQ3XGA6_9ACTN|nr:hypothetical protein [Actinoplanes couchii]GID57531.1 hypothetical protein Aco03nite_059350 [Actinoplanes couchii]
MAVAVAVRVAASVRMVVVAVWVAASLRVAVAASVRVVADVWAVADGWVAVGVAGGGVRLKILLCGVVGRRGGRVTAGQGARPGESPGWKGSVGVFYSRSSFLYVDHPI